MAGNKAGYREKEPSAGSQVLEDPAFYLKSKGKKHQSSVTHPGHEKRLAGRLSVQRERKGSGSGRERAVGAARHQDGRGFVHGGGGGRARGGIWDTPRGRVSTAGRWPGGCGNGVNRVTLIKTNVYQRGKKNPLLAVDVTGM